MAAKNYEIGRRFEYRIIAYLRKKGYYCLRAFASKGLYDIIAIPPINQLNPDFYNYPLLIQAKKNGYCHPKELENLKQNTKWQGWVLISWSDKGKLKFRDLSGKLITVI